jgi:hypothetical protein
MAFPFWMLTKLQSCGRWTSDLSGLNLLGIVYPIPSFPRRRESTFCFNKLDPRLRGDDGLVVIQLRFILF